MKTLMVGACIVLISLNAVAHADEASQKMIAEELLRTMKVDQMTKPLFVQMRSMLEQQFTQMGAPDDLRPILNRYTDKLFSVMEQTLSWQALKEDYVSIYMGTFTEDELKGMVTFYKSPLGQAVIDKMPVAMQQAMQLAQKRGPELQEKIKEISEQMAQEIKLEMEKKKEKQNDGPQKRSGT